MTNSETKKCQNCHKDFVIEPEDFVFYEKIKVPPPTWCPECRLARRMMWRNERSLYRTNCGLCGKNIIAIYSPKASFNVYCRECFWSDKWDPLEYGQEYDFSKSFFQQLHELRKRIPRIFAMSTQDIDCEYVNGSYDNKKCYLIFASDHNEDSAYSHSIFYSKDVYDALGVYNCELSSQIIDCEKCSRAYWSQDCVASINIYFCKNCHNCNDCVGCVNLRNKSYYIFNKQHSKEDYFFTLKELNIFNYSSNRKIIEQVNKLSMQLPLKYIHGKNNLMSSGDYLNNTKKCFYVFSGHEIENCKFINICNKIKDSYDGWGVVDNVDLNYEVISSNSSNVKFNFCFWGGYNGAYCDTCEGSNNLFGCIDLRNKQYCILNKQYTKSEYESLVPKIIEHMNKMPYIDKKGRVYRYGEFFPPELSPFAYNETIAQEYFPLTKEQAIEQSYSWKDPEEREIKIDIKSEELPDHIKDVDDSIIGKVIQCAHAVISDNPRSNQRKSAYGLQPICNEQCTTAFKIIEPELQFYRRMNLPLPRLCPNCRHYQRLKQRNPLKLWHRKCQCAGNQSENGVYKNTIKHFHGTEPCPNEFETTYAPERPEIVYCEQCYLAEVV